jgi:thioredoxin-like negative regulator of GroEL
MEEALVTKNELQEIIQREDALIIYFYNDNCAPCISLRPKVKKMVKEEFPKMKIFFINSEKHPEMTAQHSVFANPTLLVFFDGKEFIRKSKYVSIPELSQSIERIYNLMFGD